MIGKMVRRQSVSEIRQISTACVDNKVHVTFKGENRVIGQREHLICMAPCDCKPGQEDSGQVEFIDSARALVEGYTHNLGHLR